MVNKKITTRASDYSQWYLDIISVADLAEVSMVRGCMVIKPYGFALWENIRDFLDKRFKETGHQNAYFPIFIPKSLLSREADHIKGFAKECAVVTHHRLIESPDGKSFVDPSAKLEEELIVRPTSETIMYATYKDWIKSWRDLPVMINQWNNVVRWELRTRPFLRTTEFLWQEGHTAHETEIEADNESKQMLGIYQELAEEYLALPVIAGVKSESEKFAGALKTYTLESLMQDGKALQACTSHNLGQNFSKAFEIEFASKDGKLENVWQTSWGLSTRVIGALIMSHSDDIGLVLPPKIAPFQVVIVPIWQEKNKTEIFAYANELTKLLKQSDIRVKLDLRDYETPGAKFNEWEKKGIPLRIEVGPRDLVVKKAVAVNRVTKAKEVVAQDDLLIVVQQKLKEIQTLLYDNAKKFLVENTREVDTYSEFKTILTTKKGFISAFWCLNPECELKIKEETKASIRCLPFNTKVEEGSCIYCHKSATQRWIFAQAY